MFLSPFGSEGRVAQELLRKRRLGYVSALPMDVKLDTDKKNKHTHTHTHTRSHSIKLVGSILGSFRTRETQWTRHAGGWNMYNASPLPNTSRSSSLEKNQVGDPKTPLQASTGKFIFKNTVIPSKRPIQGFQEIHSGNPKLAFSKMSPTPTQ